MEKVKQMVLEMQEKAPPMVISVRKTGPRGRKLDTIYEDCSSSNPSSSQPQGQVGKMSTSEVLIPTSLFSGWCTTTSPTLGVASDK
ncbi:hypothetical protein MRB53_019790 [Persea americana]|uniref:Uncharacterized protein n=1 Tax=Persea americana TaxID=3435 RepID=A0ACC2KZQ3_PERAE|nr:hypothetical protein MRB53_019790 [Persea americana]